MQDPFQNIRILLHPTTSDNPKASYELLDNWACWEPSIDPPPAKEKASPLPLFPSVIISQYSAGIDSDLASCGFR